MDKLLDSQKTEEEKVSNFDERRRNELKEFTENSNNISQIQKKLKLNPLGQDRMHNTYWYFEKQEGIDHLLFIENLKGEWGTLNSFDDLETLLSKLDSKGHREYYLKRNLNLALPSIKENFEWKKKTKQIIPRFSVIQEDFKREKDLLDHFYPKEDRTLLKPAEEFGFLISAFRNLIPRPAFKDDQFPNPKEFEKSAGKCKSASELAKLLIDLIENLGDKCFNQKWKNFGSHLRKNINRHNISFPLFGIVLNSVQECIANAVYDMKEESSESSEESSEKVVTTTRTTRNSRKISENNSSREKEKKKKAPPPKKKKGRPQKKKKIQEEDEEEGDDEERVNNNDVDESDSYQSVEESEDYSEEPDNSESNFSEESERKKKKENPNLRRSKRKRVQRGSYKEPNSAILNVRTSSRTKRVDYSDM